MGLFLHIEHQLGVAPEIYTSSSAHLLFEVLPDYPERISPVAPEVLSAGLLSACAL